MNESVTEQIKMYLRYAISQINWINLLIIILFLLVLIGFHTALRCYYNNKLRTVCQHETCNDSDNNEQH